MRVTLDTNVIVSALLSPHGAPADIIRRWERGDFEVVTSPALIRELERVLTYEKIQTHLQLSPDALVTWIEQFRATTVYVQPDEQLRVITRDSDDNRVLECAMAAQSSYIVSGDDHLLSLKEYEGIVILDPNAFVLLLATKETEER